MSIFLLSSIAICSLFVYEIFTNFNDFFGNSENLIVSAIFLPIFCIMIYLSLSQFKLVFFKGGLYKVLLYENHIVVNKAFRSKNILYSDIEKIDAELKEFVMRNPDRSIGSGSPTKSLEYLFTISPHKTKFRIEQVYGEAFIEFFNKKSLINEIKSG